MAENIPSTPGGLPPRPPEGAKVQPKKETVRITLPPKPSAAPTIKLPTLPPGGPSGAPGAAFPQPAAAAHTMPAPAKPPSATTSAGPQRPAQQQRPAPAPARPQLSGLDKGLIVTAAVLGLVALGSTIFCLTLLTPSPGP
jgi:hypothetical protein